MIKALPFILTVGSEKFKQFLANPFTIDMLYPIYDINSCATLFDGWHGKNMVNWFKFTNDDKVILEFYPKYYTAKNNEPNSIKYMLSLPENIGEFVNDMNRLGIELYWTELIDKNFEPKDYLPTNELKIYWTNLLEKMGKSSELL